MVSKICASQMCQNVDNITHTCISLLRTSISKILAYSSFANTQLCRDVHQHAQKHAQVHTHMHNQKNTCIYAKFNVNSLYM